MVNWELMRVIEDKGLKKKKVAERSGMSPVRFSQLIHGYVEPNRDEKRRIAKALKRPQRELFGEAVAR